MPRKLKTYVTSVGFFDLAIAAPSMKAALEAWGSNTNLFHQGFAKEVTTGAVVGATMAKPGVVLKRPVGTSKPFLEDAPLPSDLDKDKPPPKQREPNRRSASKIDQKAARKAAIAYEREEKKRDAARRREEAAAEKTRRSRARAVEKAQAALNAAEQDHARKMDAIAAGRAKVEERGRAEEGRWQKQREKLERALRAARA